MVICGYWIDGTRWNGCLVIDRYASGSVRTSCTFDDVNRYDLPTVCFAVNRQGKSEKWFMVYLVA